jgi:hypothetical protein
MIMEAVANQLLDNLILARLLPGKKPPNMKKFQQDVERLCKSRPNGEQWESAIHGLAEEGLLTRKPFRLTEAGRARALGFLQIEALPPKTTWPLLKAKFLVPLALGVPATAGSLRDKLKKPAGLSALLIRRQFDLPDQGALTLDKVVQTLACQLICRELDIDAKAQQSAGITSLAILKKQLPKLVLSAPSDKTNDLHDAILQRWLDTANGTPQLLAPVLPTLPPDLETRPAEPSPLEVRELHLDPATFAATVLAAARTCPTGHWGDNKIFINHVWWQLQQEPNFPRLELAAFKERLNEANQRGLLRLERADLVEAMNPDDVRESETTFLTATYHFILIERDRP